MLQTYNYSNPRQLPACTRRTRQSLCLPTQTAKLIKEQQCSWTWCTSLCHQTHHQTTKQNSCSAAHYQQLLLHGHLICEEEFLIGQVNYNKGQSLSGAALHVATPSCGVACCHTLKHECTMLFVDPSGP
ncbi:hypothetical protein ABBQ38_011714 [Trebouxia sp. C0009 RCD-2024]